MTRHPGNEVPVGRPNRAASLLGCLVGVTCISAQAQEQVVACQVQVLLQPQHNLFGHTLATEGEWLAVSRDADAAASNLFIYERSNDQWLLSQELLLSNGANVNEGLLMQGGSLFVGAFDPGIGQVHVYTESGGLWSEQAILTAPDDSLGFSLSLDGDTLVAGAPFEDSSVGGSSGGVYLFHRTGSTWQAGAHLVASDPQAGDEFGRAVALSGNTLIAGAPGVGQGFLGAGAAYVFELTAGQWSEEQKVVRTDTARFGEELLFDGDSVLISAPDLNQGALFVYGQLGTTWQELQKLEPGNPSVYRFGKSLHILADRLAVGGSLFGDYYAVGAAVLFERASGTTSPWAELTMALAIQEQVDPFAEQPSVVLTGDQLAIGVSAHSNSLFDAVSVFDLVPDAFNYCTAKLNSLGCSPTISASGFADAFSFATFDVGANMLLNGRNGLLFYGTTGPAAIPFNGGLLCVQPPLRRTGFQNSQGTTPPTQDCTGGYSYDFNAHIRSGVDPSLVAGASINAQYWSRDPNQSDGTGVSLTDGVEFVICP